MRSFIARYITEHDVRPLEPTLDSSEDKPKEITEVLDKADIEEETINYKGKNCKLKPQKFNVKFIYFQSLNSLL